MSDQVYWTIEATINDGKYEALEQVCQAASAGTKEADPGAIHYEWWVDDDKKHLHLHERYTDSAAVMGHMQNAGEAIGKLMECITVSSVKVYGAPNDDVRAAFAQFQPTYFTNGIGGFSR